MRDDDDHIRQFMPVLRRIIILVAVLTAIPVAMWTITAFVRTYIGPPKAPNYQPTPLASRVTSDEAAAATANAAGNPARPDPNAPTASVVVARATTTDADVTAPAGDPASANTPVVRTVTISPAPAPPASTSVAPAPVAAAPPVAWPSPAPDPAPATNPAASQTPDNAIVAAQQPAPTNWPAPQPSTDDALPAGEPISGKVPLPRKRPNSLVVAQSNIPLPRPRPDIAGAGAPAPSSSPLGWIHNIFQPSTGAATPTAAPADENSDTETPH